jgi:N-acetylneuraminate lyase|eukprot:g2144.t1
MLSLTNVRLTLLAIVAVVCVLQSAAATEPLRVHGLVAATFTPFTESMAINPNAVEKQAAWLNKTGVKYVFVSGTTGESVKLTLNERLSQAKLWVELAKKYGMTTIIHVGAECLEDAKTMASNAQSIGADAVGAMPPSFFKPASVEALAAHMSAIALSAPKLPFYYYHIPSMDGVVFPMYDFVQAMEKTETSNFAGIKYTGLYQYPGFMDAARILAYKGGRYEVLSGRDEMMLEALAAGIKGFVGSQFNFVGDLYNKIRHAFEAMDLDTARNLQLIAINLLEIEKSAPPTANAVKYVMGKAVEDIGPARLPNLPLSAETKASIDSSFASWCNDLSTADRPQLCRNA